MGDLVELFVTGYELQQLGASLILVCDSSPSQQRSGFREEMVYQGDMTGQHFEAVLPDFILSLRD